MKHTKSAPPAAGSDLRRQDLPFAPGTGTLCFRLGGRTHKQAKGKARMTHLSLYEVCLRSACKCVGTSLPLRKHLCRAIIRGARLAVAEERQRTGDACPHSQAFTWRLTDGPESFVSITKIGLVEATVGTRIASDSVGR